jgi:hypothetical protein
MRKADKIALAYILSPLVVSGIFIAKSYVLYRKSQAAQQLENDARNYATAQVLKMYLNNKVGTREDYDREWQFAYMAYRFDH